MGEGSRLQINVRSRSSEIRVDVPPRKIITNIAGEIFMSAHIDFALVDDAALAVLPSLLERWLSYERKGRDCAHPEPETNTKIPRRLGGGRGSESAMWPMHQP